MTEDREQRADDRKQMTEIRKQRSDYVGQVEEESWG